MYNITFVYGVQNLFYLVNIHSKSVFDKTPIPYSKQNHRKQA